jgi:hypothetical protein
VNGKTLVHYENCHWLDSLECWDLERPHGKAEIEELRPLIQIGQLISLIFNHL